MSPIKFVKTLKYEKVFEELKVKKVIFQFPIYFDVVPSNEDLVLCKSLKKICNI